MKFINVLLSLVHAEISYCDMCIDCGMNLV